MKKLPENVERYMGTLNGHLPESGFVHGRNIPSIADLVVYNLVTSSFPGLRAIGADLSALPRVLSTVETVERFLSPPVTFYYFDLPGRG